MSVHRPSRGVPLPTFGQVLLVAILGGAGYFLWSAYSPRRQPQPEAVADGPIQDLQAVEALIEQGSEGVPELVALAEGENLRRRRMAIIGLGRLGKQASSALDTVRSRLIDENREVRAAALGAFIQICSDNDDLWTTVAEMLEDPDGTIRESAASFLTAGSKQAFAGPSVRPRGRKSVSDLTPEENQQLLRTVLAKARS